MPFYGHHEKTRYAVDSESTPHYYADMSRKFLRFAGGLALLVALLCAGCGVHRVAIQQGNIITQDMVDQLTPGITREQVAYIMGAPVLRNTFDDDRWDYVYTIDVPNAFSSRMLVSLFFENDVLMYITGDMVPSSAKKRPTE